MSRKTKSTAPTEEPKPAFVPKLRFPEFRGLEGWDFIPLSRLAIRAKQKNRDEKIDRVLTNSAEFGVVDQRDFFDKDIATQGKLEGYFVVELGSYVYNPRISSTAPVGPISKNKIGTGVMSPLYTVFKFKGDRNDFYEHYFKTTGWHSYMRQASSTGARHDRMAISSADFMAMPLPAPSLPEQQKIAECLSSLDELIAAQGRKVEALKTHKKGLMQQLFPREGETQPRLRFPEFRDAGDWEPTSIGGVARLRNGYAFKSAEYVDDGPYRIITIANVQQGNLTIESTKRMTALPPDIQQHQVLSLGDILISMTGNVGRICRITAEGLLLNQRVGKLVPEEIDAAFFYQLLQRDEFRNAMQLRAVGGAQGNLSGGDITEYAFSMPDESEEQSRIADCLSSLDALIAAASQKLEALKVHKKGLMQGLFPPPEATGATRVSPLLPGEAVGA